MDIKTVKIEKKALLEQVKKSLIRRKAKRSADEEKYAKSVLIWAQKITAAATGGRYSEIRRAINSSPDDRLFEDSESDSYERFLRVLNASQADAKGFLSISTSDFLRFTN